ncbi:unnamed protein product [Rhizophagus irregularis]|nr:unnamed protein product [Rhizophagus irregularis]
MINGEKGHNIVHDQQLQNGRLKLMPVRPIRRKGAKKTDDEEADDNGEIQCLFLINISWIGSFYISSGCRKEILDFWIYLFA